MDSPGIAPDPGPSPGMRHAPAPEPSLKETAPDPCLWSRRLAAGRGDLRSGGRRVSCRAGAPEVLGLGSLGRVTRRVWEDAPRAPSPGLRAGAIIFLTLSSLVGFLSVVRRDVRNLGETSIQSLRLETRRPRGGAERSMATRPKGPGGADQVWQCACMCPLEPRQETRAST